jgi:hypothetical protein
LLGRKVPGLTALLVIFGGHSVVVLVAGSAAVAGVVFVLGAVVVLVLVVVAVLAV